MQKNTKVIACEVKLSPTVAVSDGKHLKWFVEEELNDKISARVKLLS